MATATKNKRGVRKTPYPLTDQQRAIIAFLVENPKANAQQVSAMATRGRSSLGYDVAYATLRRLEARGYVRRFKTTPTTWSALAAGKKALTSK